MVNKKFLGLILCAEKQLDIANEIQHFFNDNDSIEVENYRHSYMFTPGTSDIGNLIASKNKYDFVIIVLTPDELSQKNNSNQYTPRDNVILEIGFFIGTLGIEKTILLKDESLNLVLPSYLDGITIAKFSRTGQLSLRAKLVSPCLEIERSIKTKTYRSVVSPTYWTNKLVIASLKVVCNALETPSSFDIAKLRAFIFKKKDNYLVCTHHWANQVIKEEVDHLKFEINEDTSNEVAVVKAAIRKEVVATYVKPLRKKNKKERCWLRIG